MEDVGPSVGGLPDFGLDSRPPQTSSDERLICGK